LRILTTEKVIERSSFSNDAACLLDSIAKSSPSCFIYDGLNLDKYLPSHDSGSNLSKLQKILPNAATTIRNYLESHLSTIECRNRNTKKKISREDVILAFASNEHIKVINTKIAEMDYGADLPWTILGHQFTVAEYIFMHTLSLCELMVTCDYRIAARHTSGIMLNDLYFKGSKQFLTKASKKGYGLVHFATVIAVTNDSGLIKKIQNIQSEKIFAEAVESLKNKVINFSTFSSNIDSIHFWTQNRFKNNESRR